MLLVVNLGISAAGADIFGLLVVVEALLTLSDNTD
jgi:hypothetical protein